MGDVVSLELMVPARHLDGFMMIAVDSFSRFVFARFVKTARATDLLSQFRDILCGFPTDVRTLILDRQSGFVSSVFTFS